MKLSNKKSENLFIYQGYESSEYFCDRENALKTCGMCLKKIDSARYLTIFPLKILGFILLFQELSLSLQLESNHSIVRTSIFLMVKLAFAIRSCKLERRKFQKEH